MKSKSKSEQVGEHPPRPWLVEQNLSQQDLFRRIKAGDELAESAREEIVLSHVGLAAFVATRYVHLMNGICSWEDCLQEANLALLEATHGFDPDFGYRFSTYAVPIISKKLSNFLYDNRGSIYIPRSARERLERMEAVLKDAVQHLEKNPSDDELLRLLRSTHPEDKWDEKKLMEARVTASVFRGYDFENTESDDEVTEDVLEQHPNPDEPLSDENFRRMARQSDVMERVNKLSPGQKAAVEKSIISKSEREPLSGNERSYLRDAIKILRKQLGIEENKS